MNLRHLGVGCEDRFEKNVNFCGRSIRLDEATTDTGHHYRNHDIRGRPHM
jgi:hypothetical protein